MELSPDEKLKRLGLEAETCFIHLKTFEEVRRESNRKVNPPTRPGQLLLNIVQAWQCISRMELLRQMSHYMPINAAGKSICASTPRSVSLGLIKLQEKTVKWKMTPVVERFLACQKDSFYHDEFTELLK